jgi:hypothetical protein
MSASGLIRFKREATLGPQATPPTTNTFKGSDMMKSLLLLNIQSIRWFRNGKDDDPYSYHMNWGHGIHFWF